MKQIDKEVLDLSSKARARVPSYIAKAIHAFMKARARVPLYIAKKILRKARCKSPLLMRELQIHQWRQ
jgi:hypothetical protein